MQKLKVISAIILAVVILIIGCRDDSPLTIKDLDECMIDLRAYQENLGDELKAGKLKDAEWLLEGMDSVLTEVKRKFGEHRKLDNPFSYYYKVKMKKPVVLIRRAIAEDDTSLGMKGYRMLVRNCNSCHDDNNIDKTVRF